MGYHRGNTAHGTHEKGLDICDFLGPLKPLDLFGHSEFPRSQMGKKVSYFPDTVATMFWLFVFVRLIFEGSVLFLWKACGYQQWLNKVH